MSRYETRVCDPMGGGSQHDWKVTLSDWVPDTWNRDYETYVIQGCGCGRLRALLWDANGKRVAPAYWWVPGRKPELPLSQLFTPADHRDRLLKRVAELEAEQRNASRQASSRKVAPQGKATQRKAA